MRSKAAPVRPCALPHGAILQRCAEQGAYVDCFVTEVAAAVSHEAFVAAFYTTRVFKLERRLLAWFANKPSTDEQARQLAHGQLNGFAAWRVAGRCADQLLMADVVTGRTMSWLMVSSTQDGADAAGARRTQLYFGSAVLPMVGGAGSRRPRMGFLFRALLGFHKAYSRTLLRAASARIST